MTNGAMSEVITKRYGRFVGEVGGSSSSPQDSSCMCRMLLKGSKKEKRWCTKGSRDVPSPALLKRCTISGPT